MLNEQEMKVLRALETGLQIAEEVLLHLENVAGVDSNSVKLARKEIIEITEAIAIVNGWG